MPAGATGCLPVVGRFLRSTARCGVKGEPAVASRPLTPSLMGGAGDSAKADDLKEAHMAQRADHHHSVFIADPPGQYAGDEERYDLECDLCGRIGTADDADTGRLLARVHERAFELASKAVTR